MPAQNKFWRKLAGIACIMALIFMSFAHLPIFQSQSSLQFVNLAAYTLPDGSIAVICKSGNGETNPRLQGSCEFCNIVNAIILPSQWGTIEPGNQTTEIVVFSGRLILHPAFYPSAPPTGPPLA